MASSLPVEMSPQDISITTLLALFYLEWGQLAGTQPKLIFNSSVPNDMIIVEYAYIYFSFSLSDDYQELSV